MQFAIFGISNGGLNLVANLFVFGLVAVYLALIVWTYLDARRRVEDPVLVTCATVGALVPFVGAFVYSILRPPELLDDVRERTLEIRAAELRVRQLAELACPNCRYPVEKGYLRCPNCQRRLKDPCETCSKPVDPRWAVCPYCETQLPGARQRQPQRKGRARPTQPRTETPPRPTQRASQPAPSQRGSGNSGADGQGSSERSRPSGERPRPVRGS
jgi:RNA polymerase subunit RPABC4/transcription elongation factor Spt4